MSAFTLRRALVRAALTLSFAAASLLPAAAAAGLPGPLDDLQLSLSQLSTHAPGHVGIDVEELSTGLTTAINSHADMPAASTIKIPVMVEVFRQMAAGTVTLTQNVTLEKADRDWGWGDLADAASGSQYTVDNLMRLMITESDNTATNMLIRLVGRTHINMTMNRLGLANTIVGDYIRSDGDIRCLRTSAADMVTLLDHMVHEHLVNAWSSREMIAILAGQQHNGLLPAPLPRGIEIAHKTGTLHDTLNDVGVVFLGNDPYVIAVMTTELPNLDLGRTFIHQVSRVAYTAFTRRAAERFNGLPEAPQTGVDTNATTIASPDKMMWSTKDSSSTGPVASDQDDIPSGALPTASPAPAPAQSQPTQPTPSESDLL